MLQTYCGAAAARPIVVAGGSAVDARSASVAPLCDGALQIMMQALSDRILSWNVEAGNVSFDSGGEWCTDLLRLLWHSDVTGAARIHDHCDSVWGDRDHIAALVRVPGHLSAGHPVSAYGTVIQREWFWSVGIRLLAA